MSASFGSWPGVGLALRSLLWTLAFPGFFAAYVPWRFFGLGQVRVDMWRPDHLSGLLFIGVGAVLLSWCIVEFARRGGGTLSPIDPPRQLVERGPYRYVRNPMYLGVTAIVLGEALVARSAALALYWALWFGAVNIFVIGYEEPTLRRVFGGSYDAYTQRVGRWIPRFPTAAESR